MGAKKNRANPHNFKDDGKARSDRKITMLEDCDFEIFESELIEIGKWYRDFRDIEPIAKWLKRDPDEIFIAIIHLARQNKLTRRDRVGL